MVNSSRWQVENSVFWQQQGAAVALQNHRLLTLNLVIGFALWMIWSVLSIELIHLGYPFTVHDLFSLLAIAGFSGASLRIAGGMLGLISGTRASIMASGLLLLLFILALWWALQSLSTPLWVFQVLALLSGVGAGCFSLAVTHLSYLYPAREQSLMQDVNAGIGNAGVSVVQILLPIGWVWGGWAWFGLESHTLIQVGGNVLGRLPIGTLVWPSALALMWGVPLLVLSIFLLKATPVYYAPSGGRYGGRDWDAQHLVRFWLVYGVIFLISAAALGVSLDHFKLGLSNELVILVTVVSITLLLRYVPGLSTQERERYYRIFSNRQLYVSGLMYMTSFGSFVGFALTFPLLTYVVFGFQQQWVEGEWLRQPNAVSPNILMYAWLPPLLAVLSRALGVWMAGLFGSFRITQIAVSGMLLAAIGLSVVLHYAYQALQPEPYFVAYFLLFLCLFAMIGLANGAIFKSFFQVFPQGSRTHSVVWIASVACYGAYYIPQVFSQHLLTGSLDIAMLGFAIFYLLSLLLHHFFHRYGLR
ncbi:MAG: hypothetical protein IBX52_08930 [Bacterioplanes sp.]|nr:hypothetical protein [Bacterioplanes sp.]